MSENGRRNVLESLEQRRLLSASLESKLIDLDLAAEKFPQYTGAGQAIAVIDTGIDYTHPALGGGFGEGFKVVGGYDFLDNDADPIDTDGHGTGVAGIIAADDYVDPFVDSVTHRGVAQDADLIALRVGDGGSIPLSRIDRALDWVLDNRVRFNITAVNLSLGFGNFTEREVDAQLSDEFRRLAEAGVFVAAASGNDNDAQTGPITQDGVSYPAADPNVFAVGAVDTDNVITDFTQRNTELDLLAPGNRVRTLGLDGSYVRISGTSFASPFAAAASVLVREANPTATPGDIASILTTTGQLNRDGDNESGNTTGLPFPVLDLDNALSLAESRRPVFSSADFGRNFDTALDAHGVLHIAHYDDVNGRLLYTTRDVAGIYSHATVVDDNGDVGAQLSIAVDASGKAGIGYFDVTETAIRYASFDGVRWDSTLIDSSKHVGTSPSVAFDVDGNAYVAYHRRSGGDVRLASLSRDTGAWTRVTVDGVGAAAPDSGGSVDGTTRFVGTSLDLDVGEAAVRVNGFTQFNTTLAIAYADADNADLRYARLDLDDPTATWYVAVVDDLGITDGNLGGVANINLDLHERNDINGLQAQIAYQDTYRADAKYAFRLGDWFSETVAGPGKLGDTVQLSFDENDRPQVTYFDRERRAIFTGTRTGENRWSNRQLFTSAGATSVATNERTDQVLFSTLGRTGDDTFVFAV
ncbi:MAG: S8 family serine peptidase [Planctomycetota bacterium]